MIELFIRRPAMTIIFVSLFMVLGLVSIGKMIIEPTPKVEFPLVTVETIYPGASPDEIETQILKKIEDAVSEVSMIKSMKSDARENYGIVLIEFLIEADVNVKSIEVKDKVEAIINDFPSAADRPIIAKFDPLLLPISTLILTSDKHNPTELYEYADKKLKNLLTSINGVASVDIGGGRERQINVWLDNNLLIKNYLSIEDVLRAMKEKNLNVPGGSIDRKENKVNVRFVGEFASVEDIGELSITSREGRVYKLKDLGRIEDSFKEIEKNARFNGKDVVALSVKKQSDGDSVGIVKTLMKRLPDISKELPEGMKLELGVDTTEVTLDDTVGTAKSIVIGVALTVLVILLFLGDWRGALIAAIVIPTSIFSTFFPMAQQSFSINMMTLLAFGTCIGTLIANALLIIENVYKHLGMGKDPEKATVDGTKEVLLAVFAGSGTNLVVFTPIAMMGGIIGKFFVQFGLTVVYATLFSIVASVSLTPMLCAYLLKRMDTLDNPFIRISKKVDKALMSFMDFFKGFFDFQMKRPFIASLLAGAFFLTIAYPISKTGGEFIPRSDRNDFTIEVVMPDGTPVEKTTETVKIIENYVKEYPEVKSYFSDIGYSGEEKARITANLTKFAERKRTYDDLIKDMIPKVANIPEADIFISGGNKTNDGLGDITFDIRGVDMKDMAKVAAAYTKIMNESGYFSSIQSSYITPKLEVQFQGDPAAIIQQKLNNAQVGTVIRALVNGDDDSVYKELGEEYDINVTLDKGFKKSPEDFSQFLIHGKDGLIPIVNVGQVKQVVATSPLKRRDKSKIIQLNGYLSKSTSGTVMGELKPLLSKIELPNGVTVRNTGKAENQAESGAEIGSAFLLAIILTYMLLVAVLDSFVFPISIASCIVTSFLGVFVFMFIMEGSINIGSMMAFVMVVGLAVNNAILMIEYAEQLMAQGETPEKALWTAAREKFKPILMTSIAIIAGSWPQIFDPDKLKSSMGSVVIGGMIGSVIFTYIMIPAVHILLVRLMNKFKKKTA
jgi:HAE1 family hydrophobic/amphiphilic exporter-1